ncbi:MAG: NADH-quinone oxidoreductase subunit NuoG [Armatimonadota bacterium]
MPTIYIDNQPYTFEEGDRNLLEVCLSLGFNLPYFCWHPAMHSVGACRQCAVKQYKDENDTRGKIIMACMTAAVDGARISINDPEAVDFRAGVIQWLMVNHPHDCPVCDEGGECHLQDMTVMTGHVYREYRFKKRTYFNQNLGPFVTHEMNRCIQCYRCIRFYRDYAGGRDFDVFGCHDHVYFGRFEEGTLESEFSGNLVEVCPTGVFTDKTLSKHYTRKWDLQTAPSICVHCGLGCNIIPGERYGTLRRIRNRYNGDVNGYFLCDRGRYGYEFVNSDLRIRQPMLRTSDGTYLPIHKEEALEHFAGLLTGKTIGIGSPTASLESNYALRTLVGADNFFLGMSETEYRLVNAMRKVLQEGPVPAATIHEVSTADAVLVLGEDVTNVAPRLDLALRQSVLIQPHGKVKRDLLLNHFDAMAVREATQDARGPFFIATPGETKLDSVATAYYRAAPDDIARLGFAVAQAIDPSAPKVTDLSSDLQKLATRIADLLKTGKCPMVVAGPSSGSEAVIHAAANVAWALQRTGAQARLCYTMPECNSMGLTMMGGNDLQSAIQTVQQGGVDTLIVLESNLYRQLDAASADALLAGVKHVISFDFLTNETTEKAELVLPAGTFAESDGTLINNEGRAQRFFQVFVRKGETQESWRWLGEIIGQQGTASWQNLDEVMEALAKEMPHLAGILDAAPLSDFRIHGKRIARQPHRYSGRTAMTADVSVREPQPPDDPDTPFSFSMEGYQGHPPAPLIPRYWAPGWNSVQALNKFQSEVGGPLVGGNPGVRLIEPGHAAMATYFSSIPKAFKPRKDEWLILPAYHIYGSEGLSMLTEGIAERAPEPYLAVNDKDAARLALREGQQIALAVHDGIHHLPVKINASLPDGTAALPAGLPGLLGIPLPAWGKIIINREGGQP